MFTADQYRAKAIEYSKLLRTAKGPNEVREYQRLERSFTELADNAQWVIDNHDKSLHATAHATEQVTSSSAVQIVAAVTVPTALDLGFKPAGARLCNSLGMATLF
jgi:hypothetical protein